MEEKKLFVEDLDLTKFCFDKDNKLETERHIVSYFFYDVGRLSIMSKPNFGGDDIYIEDYFDLKKFKDIIFLLTDFELKERV
jgi:hypothetical protein